jgi:chemotaxis response regulator CheB
MPKMAIDLGGAEKILPLNQIPNALLNAFKR